MCDGQYGIPTPNNYSDFPQHNEVFYHSQTPDPYQNITHSSDQQLFQLQRNSLLPKSWSHDAGQVPHGQAGPNGTSKSESKSKSDWYRYTPDSSKFEKYISGTGASRNRVMSRNPSGRLFGAPNLLRSNPSVPLSNVEPWFNSSGLRTDLINSRGSGPGST